MKKIFLLFCIIAAVMLLLPLSAMKGVAGEPLPTTASASLPTEAKVEKGETVRVLISKTKKVEEMAVEDYLFGVLAGEMPALYEAEALKAQAICSYTFLKWRQKENSQKDYDITDDFTTDQCYITPAAAQEKWGKKTSEYEQKLREIITSVKNLTINYNDEPILAVYHSISGGKTESAKNVWGKDYPYLQAVECPADKQAENYITTQTVSEKEFKSALASKTELPKDLKNCFSNFSHSPSGTVLALKIGDTVFTGSEIRAVFGLRSANFSLSYDGDFTFTVYGYGHGVGMSQNSANHLAKQGYTAQEILKHFYKDCEIA